MRHDLWKVSVSCSPAFAEDVEDVLADDALSIAVMTPPRQTQAHIEALFSGEPDKGSLLAKIAVLAALHNARAPDLIIEPVGNLDWLKKVASEFPPLSIARWTIYGAAHKKTVRGIHNKLQIDATSAFGTGEHPTTRGCLLMLERALKKSIPFNVSSRRPKAGCRMLDMGCGSGILAMAFAQATRGKAVAVDLDPDSVIIAQDNVRANGLGSHITVSRSRGYTAPLVGQSAPYDLIMANIFAKPLCCMAKDLRHHLKTGGVAILSGLLRHQANAVLSAHRQQGLFLREQLDIGEWSILALQ